MIVQCRACNRYYDDEFRLTFCPHDAFNANDGTNRFKYHHDAYLSDLPPTEPGNGNSTDPKS